MKILSWNVAGLRARLKNNDVEYKNILLRNLIVFINAFTDTIGPP